MIPSESDACSAHIDYKVRVPIYILVFTIYLNRPQSSAVSAKRKVGTNRISERRVEVLKRLAVT